jgi:hypothetical protein
MSHAAASLLAILYFLGGICCQGIYWYLQRKKRDVDGSATRHTASLEGLIMGICFWPLFWPAFIILHSWQARVDARNRARRIRESAMDRHR